GAEAMRTGVLSVDVGPHRDRLLAVKRGEMSFDDAEAWRCRLQADFDAAANESTLPERPDYERVNAFLVKARRDAVETVEDVDARP
ncbi:MAG: nucleotidyltransferase domain-containing protein, partial [Planctomycetota bacterium]